ncbi:hypothetical protein [Megalodesulfovibrio paquesii]
MADFNTVKPLFASKTFWGGLVAVLAGAASVAGYALSPEEQAQLVEAVVGVASALGGVVAIAGRMVATKAIK